MKRILPVLLILSLVTTTTFAQNLVTKVPLGANVVIKYSGSGLSQKLPAAKFETYTLLKNELFKHLHMNKTTTLESIGIDLQQEAYQYVLSTDTTTTFVTVAALKDADKFAAFITSKDNSAIKESKDGYTLFPISDEVFVGWNGKTAGIVATSYTNNNYYHYDYPITDTVLSGKKYDGVGNMYPYSDSSVSLEPVPDTAVIIDDKATARTLKEKKASIEEQLEELKVDSTAPAEAPIDKEMETPREESAYEKAYREGSEKFYKEQEIKNRRVKRATAEDILLTTFSKTVTSVQTHKSFAKLVDNAADISLWIDSTGNMFRNFYPYYPAMKYNFNGLPGYTQAVNIYFDATKVRMEQKLFSENENSIKLLKGILNSKQNPAYINYVSPSDLGYISVSLNTEAAINSYYTVLRNMLPGLFHMKNEYDLVDAYMDLMEIIIDEKAISDVIPGNALLILHGIKPRKVKYISYEYDKDFKSTPKEKTKTESAPDFSIYFDTRNEKIFNKLIDLPVKLNKDSSYDYKKTGSYYTLNLGDKNIINKLYFMVKDGKCVITTSLLTINGLNRTGNLLDEAQKQSLLNSNYSGRINIKDIITSLGSDVTDKKNKKMITYLQNNADNLSFEGTLKDDTYQSTTTFNIKGKHTNSLEYFFNVIEALLQIQQSK